MQNTRCGEYCTDSRRAFVPYSGSVPPLASCSHRAPLCNRACGAVARGLAATAVCTV